MPIYTKVAENGLKNAESPEKSDFYKAGNTQPPLNKIEKSKKRTKTRLEVDFSDGKPSGRKHARPAARALLSSRIPTKISFEIGHFGSFMTRMCAQGSGHAIAELPGPVSVNSSV